MMAVLERYKARKKKERNKYTTPESGVIISESKVGREGKKKIIMQTRNKMSYSQPFLKQDPNYFFSAIGI